MLRKGEMSMNRATKDAKSYNGFAVPLDGDTNLGLALLIAEGEDGCYQPVANVSTINEARELAVADLRCRRERLECDEDPGLCPRAYKLWARGIDGGFRVACEIEA